MSIYEVLGKHKQNLAFVNTITWFEAINFPIVFSIKLHLIWMSVKVYNKTKKLKEIAFTHRGEIICSEMAFFDRFVLKTL